MARIIGGCVDKFLRVVYAGMPCDGLQGSSCRKIVTERKKPERQRGAINLRRWSQMVSAWSNCAGTQW